LVSFSSSAGFPAAWKGGEAASGLDFVGLKDLRILQAIGAAPSA
jgi:hypothetical protein